MALRLFQIQVVWSSRRHGESELDEIAESVEENRSRYSCPEVSGEIVQAEIGGEVPLGVQVFISHDAEGGKPPNFDEIGAPKAVPQAGTKLELVIDQITHRDTAGGETLKAVIVVIAAPNGQEKPVGPGKLFLKVDAHTAPIQVARF